MTASCSATPPAARAATAICRSVGQARSAASSLPPGALGRGVGRALMAAALDTLRDAAAPRPPLVVRRQRARQRLLRATGFTRDGAERTEESGLTCSRSATAVASDACASRTSSAWRPSSPRTAPRSGSWPGSRPATRGTRASPRRAVPPGGRDRGALPPRLRGDLPLHARQRAAAPRRRGERVDGRRHRCDRARHPAQTLEHGGRAAPSLCCCSPPYSHDDTYLIG